MVGIYKIISPSNKIYIGQSRTLEIRFKTYKRLGCKNQKKLYNSLIKYGFNNHKISIIKLLDENVSQEVLDDYKIKFVCYFEKLGFEMLNLRSGGKGGKMSEETKSKIGKSNSKAITQFDLDGNVIQTWKSSIECSKCLKIHVSSIRNCSNGVIKSSGGFMFKVGLFTSKISSFYELYNQKPIIRGLKKNIKQPIIEKPIYQYDTFGNFIKEWKTLNEIVQELNINKMSIKSVCKSKARSAGGYIWKYNYYNNEFIVKHINEFYKDKKLKYIKQFI